MNAGRLETSAPLRILHSLLLERGANGATSLEIAERCSTVAPATLVSALRHNGYEVACDYLRRTEAGRKVYRYTIMPCRQ